MNEFKELPESALSELSSGDFVNIYDGAQVYNMVVEKVVGDRVIVGSRNYISLIEHGDMPGVPHKDVPAKSYFHIKQCRKVVVEPMVSVTIEEYKEFLKAKNGTLS